MPKDFEEIIKEKRETQLADRRNYFIGGYIETLIIKDTQEQGEIIGGPEMPSQRKAVKRKPKDIQ